MEQPDYLKRNLGYLLNRCGALMAQRFERELAPYGITLAQWGALLAVDRTGSASPSDVAERVGIDRGAATRLIARMEHKNLLERAADTSDKRAVVLRLTDDARRLMPTLMARSQQVNANALAALPEAEADALVAGLSILLSGLSGQK